MASFNDIRGLSRRNISGFPQDARLFVAAAVRRSSSAQLEGKEAHLLSNSVHRGACVSRRYQRHDRSIHDAHALDSIY